MNSRMFSYGESLIKSLSEEDDIELERKVQRLNKTPKKSFQDVIVRAVLDEYHGISGINSIYNINVTGDKYTFNSMYVTNFYHSELNLAAAGTMDPKTGNWWIVFGEDNIAVGYYPKDFVHVYGAATMAWEGYTHSGSDGVSPPLGSGHRPDHIHNHAAYYRDMRFIKDNLAEEIPRDDELTSYVAPNCHSIDDLHYSGSPKWGYIFFYGGPGGDCVPA
nr:hypothetical protein CFP56_74618 [Quercus suber]